MKIEVMLVAEHKYGNSCHMDNIEVSSLKELKSEIIEFNKDADSMFKRWIACHDIISVKGISEKKVKDYIENLVQSF